MMLPVFVLVCLAVQAASGALMSIPAESKKVFIKNFRTTLLEKVALEINNTVDASKKLKVEMDVCKPKIKSKVEECKQCAKIKCASSPTFLDILNIANPYNYLKEPLDNIGSKAMVAVKLVEDQAGGFVNSMKNLADSVKLPPEFKFIYDQISAGLKKAIAELKTLGVDIGNFVIDTGSIIGDTFKDWLGKRRRKRETIDPKVRKCMEQCVSCSPLLKPTQSEIITAVCGPKIVKANETIQKMLTKIQGVYNHTLDEKNPIVDKLQLDPTAVSEFKYTNVHITVYLNGGKQSYKTTVLVPMLDMVVGPARGMAMEYWGKFPF
ncbi:uncharacterized protein LOC128559922 [Mercenaria mercenaria]|uniref:uncharacterized protein LOC128559922 n=1 Tax=Mercenaria mercenaria TaxID=6596 RepID=UPI00234EF9C7|nr:uncharacterized protein LOC128559922 [Mercenaria mercenaria]XP_053409031.1 uncharacterized protein LOC128559922 [Mercenaria mercenaria]